MDIQNEEQLEFFVNYAKKRFAIEYLSPNQYPVMVLHDYLIENPIVHEHYVIADVYREFATLSV